MLKKSIMCLAALAVVALGATSCKKDVNNEENGMQFRAIMETGSAKTELSGTNVNWIDGDEVMIYGTEQSGVYTATPDAENATAATLTKVGQPAQGTPYTAIYPASAAVNATTVTLPAVQQSVDGNLANTFPMFAQSESATLNFMNLCGVLKIHLQQEGATVSRISVTANSEINGNFSVDNSGEAPAIAYVEGGNFTTTLICSEPQDITNGKDFYIYMPAGEYSGLKVMIMNAGYGVEKNAPANATITIERSKYSTLSFVNVNMPIPPDNDHQWGLYSVSATQQVWIAPGNLQFKKVGNYTGADEQTYQGTWRFAEHQYDFCGVSSGNNSLPGNVDGGDNYNTTGKWYDLFSWGTSGYNGMSRRPGNSYYYYRNYSTNYINTLEDFAGTYYDWGVYCIGDGWRTFTRAECNYLFTGNVGNRSSKHAGATVCGVHGHLLIPDIWNGPNYNTGDSYTTNVLNAEQWAVMESYGATFLPVTNTMSGGTMYLEPDAGWYWTTTANGWGANHLQAGDSRLTNSTRKMAHALSITNNGANATGNRECGGQCAVRLIKNYVPANE